MFGNLQNLPLGEYKATLVLNETRAIQETSYANNTGKVVKPVTNGEKAVPEAMPGQTVEAENPQEKLSASRRVASPEEVEIHFDRDNESRKNKNEQIRKMHNEGKSNMAIAKELGLGVGEVKLVIDLFANKK